jgi:hypothetical protein
MAAVILAAMTGHASRPVPPPTLVRSWELSSRARSQSADGAIVPASLIKPHAVPFLKAVLAAPLCYRVNGLAHGTLKALQPWCATNRAGVSLHFAKTGTDTNLDPSQSIDTWIAGGIRFETGASYSYVVQIGTGSTERPFATRLNAGAMLAPLAEALLSDLAAQSRADAKPRTARAAGRATR